MVKILLATAALAVLFCCNTNTEQKTGKRSVQTPDTASTQKEKTVAARDTAYLVPIGDSVTIPPFEIEVRLSKKAEQQLANNHESIIVHASFSGMPSDTTTTEYRHDGQLFVAAAQRELFTGRVAVFEGIRFAKKTFALLADKDITLLINIYSGRHASKDNVLNCDILEDKMSMVKNRRFVLKGKLIYGDD